MESEPKLKLHTQGCFFQNVYQPRDLRVPLAYISDVWIISANLNIQIWVSWVW